uniref:Uncharacterized protein n=1 Tax=Cucumis melo TaxID=3656 RepID=A0A9I9DCD0_CUCME
MAAKPLTTEAIAITEKKMDMALGWASEFLASTTSLKCPKIREIKAGNREGYRGSSFHMQNKMQKFPNNATQDRPRKLQRFMDSRSSLRQGALANRRSNFQGNQFALATEVARKAAVAPIRPRAFTRRAPNWNKTRIHRQAISLDSFDQTPFCCEEVEAEFQDVMVDAPPPVPKKSFTNGNFVPKVSAPAQQQTNATPRQRPQTLDSLFANMKEQRLRVLSQRQNGGGGGAQQQRNGGRQQRPPWGKRPFW